MKFSIAFTTLLASVFAKNIILTNDDSWVATNIRAAYYELKDAGHDVYLVAPVSQRSGWGGKFDVPGPTLQTDGEFGHVKAGAPSWGHEPNDDHIWYFNGTPASSVAFGLKYVLPVHFKSNVTIDLVVAGPNEGTNLSPGLFTLSGTIGAAYNSVYRNIPAVAFSGSNGNNSYYKDSLDLNDTLSPSTIYAKKVVEFVDELFKKQGDNARALPLSVGVNVNLPPVGYESKNESCVSPTWVSTRLTGADAGTPDLEYDAKSNTVKFVTNSYKALSNCVSGDCGLPSESKILDNNKCESSVSIFAIDYDANSDLTKQANSLLEPLFSKE